MCTLRFAGKMFFNISSVIFSVYILMACCSNRIEATCLNTFTRGNLQSPINIESSKVIQAETSTPITLHNALFGFLNYTNSGKTLIAYTNQHIDPSSITGGVLCNEITFLYKIHTIIVYINQDPTGRSGHSIDGKGWPIEVWVIYYNRIYGSLEHAQGFPNGLIAVALPVKVGKIPNAAFSGFEIFLSSKVLKQPYSSSKLFGLIGYPWFDQIGKETRYYAYVGSYVDPKTGKQYPRAKVILLDPEQAPSISYEQFAAFKNVHALDGKPVNFTLPIHPQGSRKVYKSDGLAQIFIPIP